MPSILIVDDLSAIHEMLAAVIQPTGYDMVFALNGEEALERYKADPQDVVLADISMEPMDGIELLKNLKAFDPECVVVLMTGYASTETAISALKFGAFDYIQKPFKIEELLQTLRRAMEMPRVRGRRGQEATDAAEEEKLRRCLIGESQRMRQLRQQAVKMMAGRAPILLQGERGTGKRTLAELIHEAGEGGGPLVVVDCAEQDDLGLAAGFGDGEAPGVWVERAKEGTLLLENIDALSRPVQGILVGVIKRTVDVRIICTVECDLEGMVDAGEFDDELFYRIAALPLYLPPLREHLEDLPELVRYFSKEAKHAEFEAGRIEFSENAIDLMRGYSWPGNVAELAQVVMSVASHTERRVVLADQLPEKLTGPDALPTLVEHLAKKKREYMKMVLKGCEGDREKAAKILGCAPGELDEVVI